MGSQVQKHVGCQGGVRGVFYGGFDDVFKLRYYDITCLFQLGMISSFENGVDKATSPKTVFMKGRPAQSLDVGKHTLRRHDVKGRLLVIEPVSFKV